MKPALAGLLTLLLVGGCVTEEESPADAEGSPGERAANERAAGAAGAAELVWPACSPGQVPVLLFGTFHFAPAVGTLDVRTPDRQQELARVLDALAGFDPTRIAVEAPYEGRDEVQDAYRSYLGRHPDSVGTANEIGQVGFRLARRLGHDSVFAVDVPMNLWHDSIQVFDERWPPARDSLRARWRAPVLRGHPRDSDSTLSGILRRHNTDMPPRNREMYAGFLPLVRGDVYAGALKLRPWYDRNLRIVQNLFRIAEPGEERLLLVIGSGHLRVLKQIMEMTPQLCPVSALPYLEPAG